MEITASLILVQMVENSTKPIDHVFAQIIKYGLVAVVFHPKFHVIMVEFGIQLFMLVNVLQELTQIIINATLSLFVEMEQLTILLTINVHALMDK